MTCYFPIKGWRSKSAGPSGKFPIVFERGNAHTDLPVSIPCGQCIGCRLDKSQQWATRCTNEAQLHEENSFITLTYDDHNLPPNGSLNLRHFQLFIKRLRKSLTHKIRFYHCGEYGETYGRPHYHALIFGHSFPDKKPWKQSNGEMLYRSPALEKLWTNGFSSIGNVTWSSAAYVARYCLKKITGDNAEDHYEYINWQTGEITQLKPEYTTMSRRPGIGSEWYEKYSTDVYPDDYIVMNGRPMRPPRFYDKKYEIQYPDDYKRIKRQRKENAAKHAKDNTPERLKVRCQVQKSKIKQLIRKVE